MKVRIVLGYPTRGEETMSGGDVMTEGVGEVPGGVRSDRLIEMVKGILEVENGGMWDVSRVERVKGARCGGGGGE